MTRLRVVSDCTTISEPAVEGGGLEDPTGRLRPSAGEPDRATQDLGEEARVVTLGWGLERPLLLEDVAEREREGGEQSEKSGHLSPVSRPASVGG